MTIYRIATPEIGGGSQAEGDYTPPIIHVRFASSNKGVRAAKRELAEAHEVKANSLEVTEVDVRRGKAGLIEYLNGFHAQVPAGYEPEGYTTKAPAARVRKPKAKKKAVTKKK